MELWLIIVWLGVGIVIFMAIASFVSVALGLLLKHRRSITILIVGSFIFIVSASFAIELYKHPPTDLLAILAVIIVIIFVCFYVKGITRARRKEWVSGRKVGMILTKNQLSDDFQKLKADQQDVEAQRLANENYAHSLDDREKSVDLAGKKREQELKNMERDIVRQNEQEHIRMKDELRQERQKMENEFSDKRRKALDESMQAWERTTRAEAIKSLYQRQTFIDVYEGESALRKCGGVYIVERSDGLIKIGETDNFERRFNEIEGMSKSAGVPGLSPIMLVPIDEGRQAVEKSVHESLKESQTSGEWFKVSQEEAKNTVLSKAWEQYISNISKRNLLKPVDVKNPKATKLAVSPRRVGSFYDREFEEFEKYKCLKCQWDTNECPACGWSFPEYPLSRQPKDVCVHNGKNVASFIYEAVAAVDSATAIIDKDLYDGCQETKSFIHSNYVVATCQSLSEYERNYHECFYAGKTEIFILDGVTDKFEELVDRARSHNEYEYEMIGGGVPVLAVVAVKPDEGDLFIILCDDINPCVAGRLVINFCNKHAYDYDNEPLDITEVAYATFAQFIKEASTQDSE